MRIGIVGCGKIAERHLTAYKKIDDVKISVSDRNADKAEAMSQDYGVGLADGPEELIIRSEIDAIDVCVPTLQHSEVILKALENDKHAFCEKPLVTKLEEAELIRERALESGKVVMSGYLYRFHPAFKLAKEVLEKKIIGDPYYAIFRVGGRGSHRAWKHKKSEGGGAINEMLVHTLNLIIWYFEGVKSARDLVTETVLKRREIDGRKVRVDAEDLNLLRLKTSKGVEVICQSDMITPSYMNYIEIQGKNGSIWTSILDYFPTVIYCKEARGVYNRGNNFFEFPRVDLFEKELRHFVQSVREEKKPSLNSVEDSIEILKVIESIRGE